MRVLTLPALVFALAMSAVAQPTPERLSERLGLSPATASAVHEVLAGTERAPGALWGAAATLSERLTDAQKAELLAAAERRPERQARSRALDTDDRAERLTDAQRRQLQSLRDEHRQAVQELRDAVAAGTLTEAEARARREALNQQTRSQVGTAVGREGRAEQRGDRVARTPRADHAPRADREAMAARMAEMRSARAAALNLTQAQADALERLEAERLEETRARQAERRTAEPGTAERRPRRAAASEAQQQARRAMQAHHQAVEAILTPEQREVMQIHRALARVAARGR